MERKNKHINKPKQQKQEQIKHMEIKVHPFSFVWLNQIENIIILT